MARHYKELSRCKMCKKRFVVKKTGKGNYKLYNYCPSCTNKYFKGENDERK